jgi:poly [ADP-ribose] polymerase
LEILTSDFYSHIPHDFGFSKAPIIKTLNDVKDKLEMLASLEQIQIAARLIEKVPLQGNVIDSNYTKLNSNIEYVAPDTDQYVLLYKYLHNTHGSTHSNYQLQILDIYRYIIM